MRTVDQEFVHVNYAKVMYAHKPECACDANDGVYETRCVYGYLVERRTDVDPTFIPGEST